MFTTLVIVGTTESKFRNVVLLFVAAPFFIVFMEDDIVLVLLVIATPLIVMRLLGLQVEIKRAEDEQFIKFPVYDRPGRGVKFPRYHRPGREIIGSAPTGSCDDEDIYDTLSSARNRDLFDS